MGLTYQAQKGRRIKRRVFCDVTTFDGYWWHYASRRWIADGEAMGTGDRCTHRWGVRSVRAFRRRLREWSRYLPPGVEFVLVSRYRGYDVKGQTRRPA